MKLQTKFSIGLAFVVSLTAIGVGGFTVWSDRNLLQKELRQRNEQLAHQLAQVSEESLFQGNLIFFNFTRALKEERGFCAALFADLNGKIQFHSDPQKIGLQYSASQPGVLYYSQAVSFKGAPVGRAYLEISQSALHSFLNDSLGKNIRRIGLITGVVLLVALTLGFLMSRGMLFSIAHVVEAMKKVSTGHREPIPFQARKDELGWMGEELNRTIVKLKELDEMKREFVAGVTHELKSPLEAIDGFVAMMVSEPENKSDFLLAVQNNTRRLRALIEDLLLAARIEAQREEFNAKQFNVCPIIEEVSRSFMGISRQKGIPLRTRFSSPKVDVWADPDCVVHVLTNLLSNAFKYTPRGMIDVDVKAETEAVKISVIDTGLGIPEADREKVFEKFYRSRSNAKKVKGTGLGLAIAKGLVDGLGGKIWAEANPPGGSIFSFTLPH